MVLPMVERLRNWPTILNSKFKIEKRRRQSILLFDVDHCNVLGVLMVGPNEDYSSGFIFHSNQS